MKLSNWSLVLATSIVVDTNTETSDNNNNNNNNNNSNNSNHYYPEAAGELQLGSSVSPLQVPAGYSWRLAPASAWAGVEAGLVSWDIWGLEAGVLDLSLEVSLAWTDERLRVEDRSKHDS